MKKITVTELLFLFLFLSVHDTVAQSWQPYIPVNKLEDTLRRNIITPEYKQLQNKFCKGWNTWYNNSVLSHVLLPESFSIDLCLATNGNRNYLKEAFKTSESEGRLEKVLLGLRSDDGSYTSLKIQFEGIDISIQSAIDGNDELILVSPIKPTDGYLVVEAGILWGREGFIGMKENKLIGKFDNKTITVGSTVEPISNAYSRTTAPRLTFMLNKEIGLYTGKRRSFSEIKSLIDKARKVQLERADNYGDLTESFIPMQTILAWNTIYDAPNNRAITPVSRLWNKTRVAGLCMNGILILQLICSLCLIKIWLMLML